MNDRILLFVFTHSRALLILAFIALLVVGGIGEVAAGPSEDPAQGCEHLSESVPDLIGDYCGED